MIDRDKFGFPTFNQVQSEIVNDILTESVDARSIYNVRLSASEIFQKAETGNKIAGENMSMVLAKAVTSKDGFVHLSLDSFEADTYHTLFESIKTKYDSRPKIIEMIKKGDLVLCYSERYKTPTAIPFIVKSSLPATVYVFVSDFLIMDQYGKVKITNPRNYAAMNSILVSAAFAQAVVDARLTTLPSSINDSFALMYGKMFEKAMMGLVTLDTAMKTKVRYIGLKFALIQMYGTELGSSISARLAATYFKDLGTNIIDHIDNTISIDAYDGIKELIEGLQENYPQFKTLSFNELVEKWIRSFGSCTVMCIDYTGFLAYLFVSLVLDSPLIVRVQLEQCVNISLVNSAFQAMENLIKSR